MKKLVSALAVVTAFAAHVSEARENRVVACNTWRARADMGADGPALVANVPRSMTPISLNAVQFTDKRIQRKMVVEGLFARRTENNNVEVMARFVNCKKEPLVLQVRSSFLDATQYPTEPTSVWKTVHVPPFATGVYQERSIATDKVANYLVELRSDQP